jgi:hypothetical protein
MTFSEAVSQLEKRQSDLADVLNNDSPECFTDQKHLEEGTQERIYWHYGYMVSLRDAVRFLSGVPGFRTLN